MEKLLKKFENGETTLEEEQQLKHYFSQETVEPHLEMYKPMFSYFLVNQQERFTKDVPLNTKRKFNFKWLSVAAVAVLIIGFYLKSINDVGTINDPEIAFSEVVQSLEMISKHFNKGVTTVGYLNEMNKGTSTIGYLGEIENATSIIFKNQ